MDVKQKAYEKYQMLWMLNHGYTLEDVWKMNREREKNPDTNWMDLKEYVASEMQWDSKEEFLKNEMLNLLAPSVYNPTQERLLNRAKKYQEDENANIYAYKHNGEYKG